MASTWPAWLVRIEEQEGQELLEISWMENEDVREHEKKRERQESMDMAKQDELEKEKARERERIAKQAAKYSREFSPPPLSAAKRRLR